MKTLVPITIVCLCFVGWATYSNESTEPTASIQETTEQTNAELPRCTENDFNKMPDEQQRIVADLKKDFGLQPIPGTENYSLPLGDCVVSVFIPGLIGASSINFEYKPSENGMTLIETFAEPGETLHVEIKNGTDQAELATEE